MLPKPQHSIPPVALGTTSVVLGTIAVVLFFLPVLGVPIAACGLALALAGMVAAVWRAGDGLRWSLAGLCFSLVALGVGLGMNYAPLGDEPHPRTPRLWQQPPVAPFVPPPARPGFMEGA